MVNSLTNTVKNLRASPPRPTCCLSRVNAWYPRVELLTPVVKRMLSYLLLKPRLNLPWTVLPGPAAGIAFSSGR